MVLRGLALVALAACGEVVERDDAMAPGSDSDGMGDPALRRGVDYSWARPSPDGIRAAGYTFAVRYLSHSTTGKNLTVDEAAALLAADVHLVVNWEDAAMDALEGRARGASDAAEAQRQADALGMPADRPIYFAIDFDASVAQQAALDDYFDGVAQVIGASRAGAYGGYEPIKRLLDGGKIAWAWQTYAWSAGRWEPRAQLRQVHNSVVVAGGECDIDEAHADDFGQWTALARLTVRAE
jgi:hypothetical protein